MPSRQVTFSGLLFAGFVLAGGSIFTGCDRKEKVIDIETPGRDIEVERSTDTGKIDVDVDVHDK